MALLRLLLITLVMSFTAQAGAHLGGGQWPIPPSLSIDAPVEAKRAPAVTPEDLQAPGHEADWGLTGNPRLINAFQYQVPLQQPEYRLAIELPVPQPDALLPGYAEPRPPGTDWALIAPPSISHLAGWKESNLLYSRLARLRA
ncbi:hypothetical protein [Ferrimonas balearica]|uniref:hypothetical protein n=1 Tax=Ferrimonas balearica TaxID=44012 RepID=UPI001C9A195A|nr:hypothetical protein [Ferrimonas balearica]MBY5991812.1 hypothetical protein [Ferrimonas balearica]